jgi:radical SAM protein with 4Fe4S-binding SPASM domain
MNCSYCYIPEYNRSNQKEDDIVILESLKLFIKKVETEEYQIGSFCLHGTEPSLMSPTALSELVNLVMTHRKKYNSTNHTVAIQTNGLRLNAEYLKILEQLIEDKKNIRISFSIDPPKNLHDKYRNKSYDTVIENYEIAYNLGFPVAILAVITKDTLQFNKEFADFMQSQIDRKKEYGNPYKVKAKFAVGDLSLTPDEMVEIGSYLKFRGLLQLFQSLSPGYCIQSGNECNWFEFDIYGNSYSCNKAFLNEGVFANWKNDKFDDIIRKRKFLYSNILQSEKCSNCEFEIFCNAGCPLDRWQSGDSIGLAHDCSLIKFVFQTLLDNNEDIYSFIDSNL